MNHQRISITLDLFARATRMRIASILTLSLLAASPAVAASINYGDFTGTSVMYLDVTESSATDPVPLYGPPTIIGNLLDFDPTSFGAFAAGGGGDITDGQLNYGAMGVPGSPITKIFVVEGGDYTLAGDPPAGVGFGIGIRITVLEIDGVTVSSPFDLVGSTSDGRTLPGDAGIDVPWDLDLEINLGVALVLQGGFAFGTPYTDGSTDFSLGVTKAEVVIDDTLFALSSPGSVAFIAKKNFVIDTDTDPFDPNDIPEPATAILALVAIGGLGFWRRR